MNYRTKDLMKSFYKFTNDRKELKIDTTVSKIIIKTMALFLKDLIINMDVGDSVELRGFGKFIKYKRRLNTNNLVTGSLNGYCDSVKFVPSAVLKNGVRERCNTKKNL